MHILVLFNRFTGRINDATLSTLMGRVPARCIVLLEDLDAAFTRSASRDDDSSGIPTGSKGTTDVDQDSGSHRHHSSFSRRRDFIPDYNTLSLSGLLNSLDGVGPSLFVHLSDTECVQ